MSAPTGPTSRSRSLRLIVGIIGALVVFVSFFWFPLVLPPTPPRASFTVTPLTALDLLHFAANTLPDSWFTLLAIVALPLGAGLYLILGVWGLWREIPLFWAQVATIVFGSVLISMTASLLLLLIFRPQFGYAGLVIGVSGMFLARPALTCQQKHATS